MKKLLIAAAAMGTFSVTVLAQVSDHGPVTIRESGVVNGRSYSSVTLNPYNRTIIFHMNDGTDFSTSGGDAALFAQMYASALEEAGVSPDQMGGE